MVPVRERPLRDLKMGFEERVQLLCGGDADVEDEELVSRGGLEVRLSLGMMPVPVLQPSPLEFPAAANALRRQGLEVRRGEPPFVVLEA